MSDDLGHRLAEPFPPAMLRTLTKGGQELTYIPGPEVTHRLNDVLGPVGWSYEVLDRWSAGETETDSGVYPVCCMAHVRLFVTIDGVTAHKDGIGGQAVKFLKNNAGPVDLGDEWKGAVTDGLKKAASAYEVGLDIARAEDAKRAEQTANNAANEREQADDVASAAGWLDAAHRSDEWNDLYNATLALAADEQATVKAGVKKAKLTLNTFTPEQGKWWAEMVSLATPKEAAAEAGKSGKGVRANSPLTPEPESLTLGVGAD